MDIFSGTTVLARSVQTAKERQGITTKTCLPLHTLLSGCSCWAVSAAIRFFASSNKKSTSNGANSNERQSAATTTLFHASFCIGAYYLLKAFGNIKIGIVTSWVLHLPISTTRMAAVDWACWNDGMWRTHDPVIIPAFLLLSSWKLTIILIIMKFQHWNK